MKHTTYVVGGALVMTLALLLLMLGSFSIAVVLADTEPPIPRTSIDDEIDDLPGTPSFQIPNAGEFGITAVLTDVYIMPRYVTAPDVLERIVITKGSAPLSPGYYFFSNFGVDDAPHNDSLYIVNDRAQLVYYDLLPNSRRLNFARHPDGTLAYFASTAGRYEVLDNTYTLSKTWLAGNGYPDIDPHEFQQLENGNVVFMLYDTQPLDLTGIGGKATANVVDLVIQEMDQANNVVFEWNSRDHFAIADTFVALDQDRVDYAHGNAIEEDNDGNFLISNRHMSEITKIDRTTGEIIWRLGGKNNEFTYIGDEELPGVGIFSYQHDIRRLENGNITIFDNGNQFMDADLRGSRGVEYELDEINKTITLVREFRTVPDTLAGFMGSVQRMPDGNTVVGWGGGVLPQRNRSLAITEFAPDGTAILHLGFYEHLQLSYRARKYPWQGFPTYPPVVVYDDSISPALYYSWNGATEVISYTVLGGVTPDTLAAIDLQPKTDFEDSTLLDELDSNLCFFQVIPVVTPEAESIPTKLLYRGDESCPSGLRSDNSQIVSRSFTYTQSAGVVTETLTLNPGDFFSPTIFVQVPEMVSIASAPIGQTMSDVHFNFRAFEGEEMVEVKDLAGDTQVTIEYGALDLSRTLLDVNLWRWDDSSASWTDEGITLLARNVAKPSVTYALARTGEYALFVANNAPQSAAAAALIDEDSTYVFAAEQIPYFDLDGDPFVAMVVETLPLSGSLTFSDTPVIASQVINADALSQLVFTPEADHNGTPYAGFDFKVRDRVTESVPYSFTFAVGAVNDAPVAVDDSLMMAQAANTGLDSVAGFIIPIAVLANDFDVDGDTLRIVALTQPSQGAIEIVGELIIYESLPGYDGADEFEYTIADGHGGQGTATVTVQRANYLQYLPRVGQ